MNQTPLFTLSKTFDPSLLLQVQSDSESKCERRKPQSCQVHDFTIIHILLEFLLMRYTCALQKDILYQGRLFVSDNWICFHSKVFGKDTKIAIPVASVTVIKKTKTAILVPNALVISTALERHVFVSFLSRDTTYKVLMSVCPHLVVSSSPIFTCMNGSDFIADLSDLDGPVRQPGQHMDDSSSSDCPESPDFVKTPSVVCVLLLSSCYMAFKIVSLEERLTSLVSLEFPNKRDEYQSLFSGDTAEIYSVLSASLLKLEKVCLCEHI
uniref:GRAM domain-containing protein n=1 Tax=Cyprinus carpio carpio TaxID=630221 RepID=A0A8C1I2Z0_CYPCA